MSMPNLSYNQGGPLRVVNPKTDTGWDRLDPGHMPPMITEYMPGYGPNGQTPGGSTYGTSYSDPGGGWNPWSLYDGRQGYDGSAVDGWYNAAADTKKGWGPNGTPESDRDRVWRMTLDALGPNPGGQPPERVKQVFLEQVARLKRDYNAPENAGLGGWANSPFAGYDRLAQGGQAQAATNPNGATQHPIDRAWSSAISNASSTPTNPVPGGSSVADINGGGGSVQPTPSPAPAPTPQAATQTTAQNGPGGIPTANNLAILQSPEEMLRIVLGKLGINGPLTGPFASFFKDRLMKIIDSAANVGLLNVNGKGGSNLDNLQGILSSIAASAQGGHFFGDLGGIAGQGINALQGNPLVQNAGYDAQKELLSRINALNEVGMSPYAAQGVDNMFNQADYDYMAKARQGVGYTGASTKPSAFTDYLGNTGIGRYYGMGGVAGAAGPK